MATLGSFEWYYLFPIILTVVALFKFRSKRTGVLIFFILFFFNVFRGDGVGNDTMNYISWDRIRYLGGSYETEFTGIADLGSNYELITIWMNRIVYMLNLHPRWIITMYSLITYIFLWIALKKFRVNIAFASIFYVLLNLYFFSLSAARQMAAVSVILYAYSFLFENEKRKSIYFFVWGIIASLIHVSSIFVLFIYPVKYLMLSRRLQIGITIAISSVFVLLAINPLSAIYNILGLEYIGRYVGEFDLGERSLIGRLFSFIQLIFFYYFFTVRNNKTKADLYDNLFCIAVLFYSLFSSSSILIGRIGFYFSIFSCIYLSTVTYQNYNSSKNYRIIFILYAIFSIYDIGAMGANGAYINGYYFNFM